MLTLIIILLIAFCILAIHNTIGLSALIPKPKNKKEAPKTPGQMRQKKSVMAQFEKAVNEKVGTSKRYQKEKLYLRAGIKLTYAQGVLIGLALGVVCFIATQVLLDNLLLATVMFAVAFLLPDQAIKFMKNKRDAVINQQIGSFFSMVMKRFEVLGDFYAAFLATEEDFQGQEPMCSEIQRARLNIQNGMPLAKALKDMGNRLENKYLSRFADYYEVSAEIGTEESRNNILYQAVEQYKKNEENMRNMRKQLNEVTMEAYVMLAFVPIVVVYSCMSQPSYIEFVTTTLMGKIGLTVIVAACLGIFWFINTKIGAPLE